MIVKAMLKYAKISIPERQEERYSNAISAYNELKDSYPQSSYIADASKLYAEANTNINKLRNEHK